MDGIDRYVLGLAVLEGDRDARKILADLLEEQGDRGLADWARRCTGKTRSQLALAIMLLPAKTCVRLGSEFLSVSVADSQNKVLKSEFVAAQHVAEIICRWYQGEIGDESVASLCRSTMARIQIEERQSFPLVQYSAHDSMHLRFMEAHRLALIDGLESVVNARAACGSNGRLVHHFEQQANQRIRQIAKGTETWIVSDPNQMGVRVTGLQWQVTRTKAVFSHLISPEEFSWPQ